MISRQKLLQALPAIERYAATVLAVVCTLAIRLVLDPVLGDRAPYLLFLLTLVVVNRLWGRGPGLLATVLGGISAWYFIIEPHFSFAIANRIDAFNLAGYFVVGASVSFLGERSSPSPDSRIIEGRTKLRVIRQTAVLAGAAVVLAGMVLLLQRDFKRTREAEGWVVHTYRVINSSESLLSMMKDAETGERGYLLTGDESYLAPYNSALTAIPHGMKDLRDLTSDNPRQRARWVEINRLTDERMSVLTRAVELRKSSQVDAALAVVRSGEGEQSMDELRSELEAVMTEERRLLVERTAEAELRASRGRWVLGLGSGALILLLVFASAVIERETVRRDEITQALRRHADLLEQTHDSLLTCRLGGAIDFWSRGAEALFGYTREEAVGRLSHELLQSYHPLGMAQIDALLERDGQWKGELTQTTKDGRKLIVEGLWKLVVDAEGNKTVLEANRDITERKRAEEELRRVNRVVQTISECDQVLVRATEESHLLDDICGILVRVGGYRMAWVGYVEHDEGKSARPVARAGFEDGYLQTANITWGDTERGQGPTGTAIRTRRPVVTRNIQTGPGFAPWREDALRRGYLSNIALPILLDGQALGALTVYAGEADTFDSAEVQLLTQLSDDLAYGIQALRTRAERKRAEEALRQSEAKLREALLAAQMGVWDWTVETDTVTWDENLYRIAGRDPKLPAPSFQEQAQIFVPESWERLKAAVENTLATGTPYDLDLEAVRPDGSERWVIGRGEPLRDANGHITQLRGTVQDITERKRAEHFQYLSAEILRTLNEPLGVPDVVNQILEAIKRETGLDAVGIRLRSGDDFPYFVQSGFSNDFLLTENTLVARDKNGGPCRDKDGNISLECTCGLVISGQTDPANSFFTKGGSFWTNNSLPLLDLPGHQDPRLHPRNTCIHQGYCSVALIPIRTHRGIVGLLQLNDRKKDCFTLEMIHFFEGISASIGVALMRKQQEETLRESDQRYRDFISHSNEGVWRVELEEPIPIDLPEEEIWKRFMQNAYMAECNLAHARNLGFSTLEEMVGVRLQDLVAPSDQERLESYRAGFRGEIRNRTIEYRGRDKAGNFRHFLRTEIPIIRDGLLMRVWGNTRDVTELRKAEEALMRSEYLLRESQRVGRIGSYELDLVSGRFITSTITEEIFGVGSDYPKDINGWLALVHPGQREEMSAYLQQVIAEKQRAEWVFHIVRPSDGAERWVSGNGELVLDSQSRPVKMIGTIQDITEAKQAQEAIKQSELRFRQLFERSESGLVLHEAVFDAHGDLSGYRCLDINPACERMMGLSRSQVLGRCAHEVFPELGEFCARLFGRVAATNEPVAFEDYSRTMGRYFAGSAYSPRANQFAVSFMDVTERKRAEEDIRLLNVELEKRVRSRTAALEAANRELEAFAHSVSHDLRAPLRGIDGWSLALREDYGERLDAQGNKYLERVRSEAQRMGKLIDDLLHLSRVSRAELVPRSVDLTPLVETIVARLKEANPGRSLEFTVAPQLKCTGDAPLLEIALTNLLDNAVKFTGPRNPARVEFGRTEYNGNPAFFVRDNGVGFDMAYAGMLFAPFQRLHKASEFPGTGIGLATVQRVIHRHGGRIWAEAHEGRGATLYFTIGENKP